MSSFKPFPYVDKRKSKQIVELDKDEDGKTYITERYLKDLCQQNGQYSQPELNDTLYLHYKGF